MADIKIYAKTIEQSAKEQIESISSSPAFKDSKIRIMPDVHAGKGCVIGFTATISTKIIPNVVGVDIGCGMLCCKLNKKPDFDLLQKAIEQYIPSGRNVRESPTMTLQGLKYLKCYKYLKDIPRLECSLGTLGGGNHFIEVDIDSKGDYYLVIHTGSRNLGKQVAEYYQNIAIETCHDGKAKLIKERKELISRLKAEGRGVEIPEKLKSLNCEVIPDDLCYLNGYYAGDYLFDMHKCQLWADENRKSILLDLFDMVGIMQDKDCFIFDTIHNYIDINHNIVRKGAISANLGELCLIPMNMRDGSLICSGKGNKDWNNSAPHGAGRLMSRAEARKTLTMQEFEDSMSGIYSDSICKSTIDEAPMAYKPIDEIISQIGDTVDILDTIKPVFNFKAKE